MRSFASIKLGSLGSLNIHHSISSGSDRPAGVAADAWIRLEENLGLVITAPHGANASAAAAASGTPPAASGYLVFKHNGFWMRLNLESHPGSRAA